MKRRYQRFKKPGHLLVVDVENEHPNVHWLMTTLQAAVNRKKPRLYLLTDNKTTGYCKSWLDYYKKRFSVTTESKTVDEALAAFRSELRGYVVYDPAQLYSCYVALTLCGVEGGVVAAAPSQVPRLKALGLERVADLRGRWRGHLDAYRWALKHLWPRCNQSMIAHDVGGSPDYLVACKAFFYKVDGRKDEVWPGRRAEAAFVEELYRKIPPLATFFGWINSALSEHAYVPRNSDAGGITLCCINPNFSVHAGIEPTIPFKQPDPERGVKLEKGKVYICFGMSDGDSIWAMYMRQQRKWEDPLRGSVPVGWGIQPLLRELAPGILQYYFETATRNDELVVPSCGAGYCRPSRMPNLDQFAALTRRFARLCDMKVAMGMVDENYDGGMDRLHNPETTIRLTRGAGLIGIEDGYEPTYRIGVPWLEQNFFVGDVPWVRNVGEENFSWQERLDPARVAAAIRKIADLDSLRPLFLPLHLCCTHGAVYEHYVQIVKALDPKRFKAVRPSTFMRLLRQAKKEGLIRPKVF